jgi:hypothetical protein
VCFGIFCSPGIFETLLRTRSTNALNNKKVAHEHVVTTLGIEPYDVLKVIESVLQQDAHMPVAIVRRLARLEEVAVESLVWRRSSALWAQLDTHPLSRDAVRQLCSLLPPVSSSSSSLSSAAANATNRVASMTNASTSLYDNNAAVAAAVSATTANAATGHVPQSLMVRFSVYFCFLLSTAFK